jgi:hypothetical protein
MADITNEQAIAFANGRVRLAADHLAKQYTEAKSILNEWNACNLGQYFVTGDHLGEPVIDGQVKPVTGNGIYGVILRLQEFVDAYDAGNGAKLFSVLQVAPNP